MQHEPHVFVSITKRLTIPMCRKCGLVRLRNALSDWCVKHGCNYDEHPGFAEAMRTGGQKG